MGYSTIQEWAIHVPEGEIVRVADRIAYVNHDVDDALRAGIISSDDLPPNPISVLGEQMSARIDTLVRDMISNSKLKGEISLSDPVYETLMELRSWLFRHVYDNKLGSRENQKRPASLRTSSGTI